MGFELYFIDVMLFFLFTIGFIFNWVWVATWLFNKGKVTRSSIFSLRSAAIGTGCWLAAGFIILGVVIFPTGVIHP